MHGVDVIGVRSANEAAENQSFLRTAVTLCLCPKRGRMTTGLGQKTGCNFTRKEDREIRDG